MNNKKKGRIEKMLDEIIKEAIKNGGATLTATLDNAKLKYNYMVSLYGYETTFKVDDIEGLKEGLKAYQKKASGKKDLYIGLWVSDGLVYLDLSINICKKNDALRIGKQNKQKAVYDVKNNKDIKIKYKDVVFFTVYNEDMQAVASLDTLDEVVEYTQIPRRTVYNFINKDVLINNYYIYKDIISYDELVSM